MAYYNNSRLADGRNGFHEGRRSDYDERRNGYKTAPDYGGTPFMEVPLPEWKVPAPGLLFNMLTIPRSLWNSWQSRSTSAAAPARLEAGGSQRPKAQEFEANNRSLGKDGTTSRGYDEHHARSEAHIHDLEVRMKQKDTIIGRLESDIKHLGKGMKELESDFVVKSKSYFLEKMRADDLEKLNRECQERLRMETTRAESIEGDYLVKLRAEKVRGLDAEREKGKLQGALQSEKMRGDNLERELRECQARLQVKEGEYRECQARLQVKEGEYRECLARLQVKEGEYRECLARLQVKEGEYRECLARLQVKEREVGELHVRLQPLSAAAAALEVREAELKILQASFQDVKRENQELKSWKLEQERVFESDKSTTGELNTKVSQLTTAHAQLEKQKQTLSTSVQDQDKRIQELKQQVAALKVKIVATESEAQSLRERLRGERDKTSKLSEALQQKSTQIEASSDRAAPADALQARLREEVENTARLSERLQQCNVEIDALKHQIRDFARGRDTDSVEFSIPPPPPPPPPGDYIGGESFLETEATPYVLNAAVQRVHEVAGIFARLLMKAMEQGKIDGMAVARNNFVRSTSLGKAAPLKYVLEAITCKLLFQGFEHECFDLQDSASGFLDMEQQRVDNFREYKYLSTVESPEQLVHKADTLFTYFCRIKLESLSHAIPEIEGMVQEIINRTFEQSLNSSDESGDADVGSFLAAKLGVTFVKLAVCVWQVHKLVFSFNPVARIFRVAQSEKFVEKYMESVIFQESESDEDDMGSVDISRVDFMVVPGFLINKIVVRSRVFVVTKPASKAFWIPNGS